MRCAALVLAAGRGTRFGGQKLLAGLHGRPVLQHVIDAAVGASLAPLVVVVGDDAEGLERALSWHAARRLRNPQPERGLAGSLKLGLDALASARPVPERALVLLGDQPLVSVEQLRLLADQPLDVRRPVVVPRYDDGRRGNPVLLERAAWPLAEALTGDRGMSQLFGDRPMLVREVDVPGSNPDVDTPDDLERLNRAEGPARSFRRAVAGRSRP